MEHIHAPAGHPATEKLRVKGGAKRYKSGPKPTGRERFRVRLNKLAIDLHRFAVKPTTDPGEAEWAKQVAYACANAARSVES